MAVSSPMLATLLCVVLPWCAIAHSCRNGERVACMDVQSMYGVPATHTHGKSARGSALCTPAGDKVYCLADHDYHRCRSGQAPCCRDGSNPFHSRHGHGHAPATTDLNCTAPLVLDDDHAQPTMQEMANVETGTYEPCMKDAYQGDYHHDNARNKGKAHVSYTFDPPSSCGCYLIEEYHPGADVMCARSLSNNVQLDVDYCKGLQDTFQINQGSHGGQWNPVAKLKFYKGHVGKLTMRSSAAEKCVSPPCFFVSDAFRVTKVSDWCYPDAHLSFQVRLSDSNTADDVLTKVKENKKSVVEATLIAHFGYHAVQVMDVTSSARRLSQTTHGEVVNFAAPVMLHGTPTAPGAVGLDAALSQAFSTIGLQLVSASLAKTPVDLGDVDVASPSPVIYILLIGGGCAAFLVCVVLGIWLKRSKMKKVADKTNTEATPVSAKVDEEIQAEKPQDKKDSSDGMDSASTGTPTSENDIESSPGTPTSSDAKNLSL